MALHSCFAAAAALVAEGCFSLRIIKKISSKNGIANIKIVALTQHHGVTPIFIGGAYAPETNLQSYKKNSKKYLPFAKMHLALAIQCVR
jgi:hypothetical protein